ncbi:MAG: LamG-like jellyroll fold domain-containing protein, partial [Planctomycetota bacterium]
TGYTIGTGGTLLLGQEQDSVGGGFDPNQSFSGTLFDARLFSDVRTAIELSASYRGDLPYNEDGMLANWRFDQLSTDGVVVDAVGGNNLTIRHTGQSGFSHSQPSLTFAIDENAIDGSVIGSVAGNDLEREQQIQTLLDADPNLRYSAETGKFYQLVTTSETWTSAASNATTNTLSGVAGQLVRIDNANENAIVTALAADFGFDVWIGATDNTTEGDWYWVEGGSEDDLFWRGDDDGYSPDQQYANWTSGEPSGADFARLSHMTGLWADAGGGSNRYIVEWDADDVLDVTQSVTYGIQSQTVAGAFEIDADTGEIRVADGTLLDADTQATHSITIRTTDVDSNIVDETFTISLNNLVEDNNAPTDLTSGIELNTDGGNDAYLIADDGGAILGGASEFTLEVAFATSSSTGDVPLFSYAAGSPNGNDLAFLINENGSATLLLDNSSINLSSFDFALLRNGAQHSLAISWDNSLGSVSTYVNGELVEQATGLGVGTTLLGSAGTGELLFGQEQDSVGGDFATSEVFSGTLYDVRFWNEVRTEAEIALNHQQKFGTGGLPNGLIANWQFDGFNGSNEVVDVVSGNNLSIGNATGGSFVASTPVEDLHVGENSVNGASVGFVVPSDPDTPNDIAEDDRFVDSGFSGNFQEFNDGDTFGGWTASGNGIFLVGSYWEGPSGGGLSVSLTDDGGSISQNLSTIAGTRYQVIFETAGEFSGPADAVQDFRISAAGQSQDYALTEPANWSRSNMMWEQRSFEFTAEDSTTTLRFATLDAGATDFGPAVGDIRVIEIPQAVSTILNNDPTLSYDAATDKFYRYVSALETWDTAQSNAVASQVNGVSGQLVTIRSAYENELIRQFASDNNTVLWLGASDQNSEGDWHWYDGDQQGELFWQGTDTGSAQNGNYANFDTAGGQPNDLGNQDHARITQQGVWQDNSGTDTYRYVIEWDASEVLSNFTFSLTDDSNGRFAIDASTGEITVADASQLDFETSNSHNVTVEVTDAAGNSYSEAMSIAIDNGLEAAQTVPGPQTIDEDSTLTFTAGTPTEVSVSDTVTSENARMRVTLSVNDGVITLSQTTGLTIVTGANGSGSIVIDGTESDLNAALDGMTFTPDPFFNGSVTLNMQSELAAELEASYTFEGGNANDQAAGSPDNGTFNGNATTAIDGIRGEVLSLDGDGDSVTVNGRMGEPANITLAAWVNLSASDTLGAEVISISDNVAIRAFDDHEGGAIGYFYDGAGDWKELNSGVLLEGTGWRHIAYTIDTTNNVQRFYVDGELVAEGSETDNISYDFGSTTTIGAHGTGNANYDFNGSIDDARVYSRALSAEEIAALAADQSPATDNVAITVNSVANPITDAHYTTWIGNSEFIVNTVVTGDQDSANVTALSDGGFVVVWESDGQDGDSEGIYFQQYNAAGQTVGTETRANTTTAGSQDDPEVTALANGGFVIVWESTGQDTDGEGNYLRAFDADGVAASGEILVNTETTDNQDTPHIASLTGGGFVVTWESFGQDGSANGIYFQRFNDGGVPQGSETIVNSTISGDQVWPRITGTNDGGFVVTWYDDSSGENEVKAQRFDSTGGSIGSELSVNTYTMGDQDSSDIVALAGGGFVITWESSGQDGDSNGVYAQRFDATGVATGSEFQVSSTIAGGQSDPRVDALPDGGFLIIWESSGGQHGSEGGVYAQQFDASGAKVNGEFLTNTTTNLGQLNPDVAILNDGRMVAVWDSDVQDGSDDAVVGRIFTPSLDENSPAGTVAAVVSQVIDADGNGTYTYSLQDDAGGAFDIQSDGTITVLDPTLIDFETTPSLTVTVRVTDTDGSGFHDEVVTISLNNLAEAEVDVLSPDYAAELASQSPVLHLRLDEGSGTTAVDSVSGNNGTYNGVSLGTDGAVTGNDAVTFNNNEYIEIPHSPDLLLDEGTIQLWFRTDDITQDGALFSKDANGFGAGGHITARVYSNGEIQVRLQSTSTSYTVRTDNATQAIAENQWNHFAFSFGSDGMKLYINGQLMDSDAYTGGLGISSGSSGNTESLLLGASNEFSSAGTTNDIRHYYEGDLDEFAVIGSQLSDSDVARLAGSASQSIVIDEDTSAVFSVAGGNAITVSDTLSGSNSPMRVSLAVSNGTLTLGSTGGITFVENSDGSASMTIEGTESDLNAALEGLTFTPDADFNGSVTLNVTSALASDLEGHYTFEGGNADDQAAGTPENGTLNGDATTTIDGTRGEVLSLDGDGDTVAIPSDFGASQNVTLSAWVNLSAADTNGADVFNLDNRIILRLDDTVFGGTVIGTFFNGSTFQTTQSDLSVSASGWRHVSYVIDSDNDVQQLFIDGRLVGESTYTDSIAYNNAVLTIGGNPLANNHDFNGLIDDARVYSRALSADEIDALATDQAESSDSIVITVNAVNDQPQFNNLDGNPTFTEGGSPVVLDGDAAFFDTDIDRGEDNYDTINLVLQRNGGANADDVFTATGNLVFQGNNDVDLSGATIGTLIGNSGGLLNIEFNATATEAQVNELLQSIAYSNESDAPPASVTINWSMEDANSGSQGSGGNLFATGDTTVDITPTNDAPEVDLNGPSVLQSIGGETRVNTTTAADQRIDGNAKSVAIDDNGNYVVVWASDDQDFGTTWGIYGQRYDADGNAVGGEFLINTTTAGNQREPSVAMDSNGDFVVVWSGNGPGDSAGIFGQRFDAAGVAQGGEFLVNTTDNPSGEVLPSVAMDDAGNFVVVWTDNFHDRIFAQRYNAAGIAQSGEILIDEGSPFDPQVQVSMNGSGAFVVAWSDDNDNATAQRYDASGNALGGLIRLNDNTASDRFDPTVVLRDDGSFVAAWTSQWQDSGGTFGVYARTFDATGTATSGDILVNTTENGDQEQASIALLADGGFLVTWESTNFDGGGRGVAAQQFDASGTKVGTEFQVNSETSDAQQNPSVAASANGDVVIVWDSSNQDGDQGGIYLQRYELSTGADVTTTFTEGGPAVNVTDSDATVLDVDSSNLSSLTVSITNQFDGTDETLTFDVTGTSIVGNYDSGTGILTLSGSDSVANYEQVLRTVQYNNASGNPDNTDRV